MNHSILRFLSKLSHKKNDEKPLPPLPPWEEIVNIMFDKGLDSFGDEIIEVIYSHDRTKRFVILKNANGCYKYAYEEIYAFDEDEWKYVAGQPDALPAIWMSPSSWQGTSLYYNYDDTMKELKVLPEYKMHFSCT